MEVDVTISIHLKNHPPMSLAEGLALLSGGEANWGLSVVGGGAAGGHFWLMVVHVGCPIV